MARQRRNGKRIGSMMPDSLFYDSRVGQLTFSALRLLMELNQQYSGFNNGNLSATPKTLRFDWCEKTLKKARLELLKAGLIEITRLGVKRRPTLYALTHVPVNEITKHGIKARETCSFRANGNRSNYFPVRKDLQSIVTKALARANENTGVKNTH